MAAKVVGSVVFATDQGLGYLAKSFYDNGVVHKVYIQKHSSRKTHDEWYKEEDTCDSVDALLSACDVLLFFETPFYWNSIPEARKLGKKTALIPMYECTPRPLFYTPDLILSPSSLDKEYYPNSIQVQIPVDEKWKKREIAKVFVHNAGYGGLGGRNGTKEVIEAMQYVKSPIELILRSQEPIKSSLDARISVYSGSVPKDELFTEGDVFLFPERFNGLSLPLQEAYASGMAVMAGDRFPINEWLPKEMLIPVERYTDERIATTFKMAHFNPKTIASTIDKWYNKPIGELSLRGKSWGEQNSWKNLRGKFTELLSAL